MTKPKKKLTAADVSLAAVSRSARNRMTIKTAETIVQAVYGSLDSTNRLLQAQTNAAYQDRERLLAENSHLEDKLRTIRDILDDQPICTAPEHVPPPKAPAQVIADLYADEDVPID